MRMYSDYKTIPHPYKKMDNRMSLENKILFQGDPLYARVICP
jgi:hypothetical protein